MVDENPYRAPQSEPLPRQGHIRPLLDRDPKQRSVLRAVAITLLLVLATIAIAWLVARLFESTP
jgi:hypothetical protein